MKLYQENSTEEALVKAFVEFDRSLTADATVSILKDLAKRTQSPVPQNVLRMARNQRMNDDDDEDDDIADEELDSAPVDCG